MSEQGVGQEFPAVDPMAGSYSAPEHQVTQGSGRIANYWHASKRSGQWALVTAEVLPTNEVIRGLIFAGGELMSRSPVVGGLSIGLSTFALASAGGLAAASIINTEKGQDVFEAINKKGQSLHIPMVDRDIRIPLQLSTASKIGWTFIGGTVIGMGLEQRENPQRTVEQNRVYSVVTSAWLAGVVAVGGALASEGINVGLNDPKRGGAIALGLMGLAASGRWIKNRFGGSKETEKLDWRDVDEDTGVIFELVNDPTKLSKAAEIEQDIWLEKGYGSLAEYSAYIDNSRTFAGFDGEDCIGVTRMFSGVSTPLPFTKMPFDNEKLRRQLTKEAKKGKVEELGTAAVIKESRDGSASTHLWRLAYRDAIARGVEKWGVIMEPRRVKAMNRLYGFTFEQVGEIADYQGGQCAAHYADLEKLMANMKQQRPEFHHYFEEQKLNTSIAV